MVVQQFKTVCYNINMSSKTFPKNHPFKTDFHAYFRAQTSSIYISNKSSWGIEEDTGVKKGVGTKTHL